jgi:hypothetical protein
MMTSIIGLNVQPQFSEQIAASKTAAEAWNSINALYGDDSIGTVWTYLLEFIKAKMDEEDDLLVFKGKLVRLKKLRLDTKSPITEEELITKVIFGLPKSMDSFCQKDLFDSYLNVTKHKLSTTYTS